MQGESAWLAEDAHRVSGDLLGLLMSAFPVLDWDTADVDGQHGLLYFCTDSGERLRVTVDREVLQLFERSGGVVRKAVLVRLIVYCRRLSRAASADARVTLADLGLPRRS